MKSPIKWMGGKKKLIPQILKNLPNFNNYFEPFMGSGIVMTSIEPKNCICSDFVLEPIAVMNSIKYKPKEFINLFIKLSDELWENGEKYYYSLREFYNENKQNMSEVEVASHFMFFIKSCFNGVIRFNPNKNYSWNVPYGKRGYKEVDPYWLKNNKKIKPSKIYKETFSNEIEEFSKFLNIGNKKFVSCDFTKTFELINKNDFVYCDPPYLITNQPYSKEWTEDSENLLYEKLCEINKMGAYFMLSNVYEHKGEKNEKLINRYKKFNIEYISHTYIVSKTQKVKEVLIRNY